MEKAQCQLPGCENTWPLTPFNGHRRFCSKGHQRKAKRQGLGNAPNPLEDAQTPAVAEAQAPALLAPLRKTASYLPPVPLDVASKWVIDQQKETIDELKSERKVLTEKLEKAIKERNELEKQLDRTQAEVAKKPSALNGFLENPEKLASVLQTVPAILAGLKEMVATPAPQIAGPGANTDGAQAHLLDQWLQQQPTENRELFINLVNKLMSYKDSAQLKYAIQNALTQMMHAA